MASTVCAECSKDIEEYNILTCGGKCGRSFHRQCLTINDKEYDKILKGHIRWTCGRPDCRVIAQKRLSISSTATGSALYHCDISKNFNEITKKIDEIRKDQSDFKSVLKYMYTGFEKMKNELNIIQVDPIKCNIGSHLFPALTGREKEEAVKTLLATGWVFMDDREALFKEFLFKDFNEAFGFMSRIALVAEKMNHHPEWFNCYNRIRVTLSSHDVNGISGRDIKLATYFDKFYGKTSGSKSEIN